MGAAAGEHCYLMPYHPIYLLHDCCLNWRSWNTAQRETLCHAWSWHDKGQGGLTAPHRSPSSTTCLCPCLSWHESFYCMKSMREQSSHEGGQLWSLDLSDHKHTSTAEEQRKRRTTVNLLQETLAVNFSKSIYWNTWLMGKRQEGCFYFYKV